MNALVTRSEEARKRLMEAAGIDELAYHLMILEAGCNCLDELVRPVNTTVSAEACQVFRAHLEKQGWWTFFELQWRHFEIRLEAEWFGPESLVPFQAEQWRRERLMTEVLTMHRTSRFWRVFDIWLKTLENEGRAHVVLPPAQPADQPQPIPQHEHIH